jgi:predicted oxidoreductase
MHMTRTQLTDESDVSRLIYGMWRLIDDGDDSPKTVQAKLEACLEQQITTIDQADIYGDYGSEAAFGRMLAQAPHLKDKIEIITKCDICLISDKHPGHRVKFYDTGAEHITAQLENSLSLMGVETIDVLLLHRPDPLMDHHETGRALDRLVEQGKVRAIGVSNFKPWDISLLQSAMHTPICTNQLEISLSAHHAFTNGDIAFCQEHEIIPMAWSPLGGGALMAAQKTGQKTGLSGVLDDMAAQFGTSPAAVAIAWLLAHPAGILPVLGSNNLERISGFSEALSITIDRQSWYQLYTAALGHEVP